MSYDAPQSRNEAILQNILGANNVLVDPQSRIEAILQAILYDEIYDEEAMSRMEELLLAIKNNGTWNHEPISRNEEILYAKLNGETYDKEPQSRIEALLIDWCNQSPITVVTDTAPYLFRQSGGDNNAYVGTEETDTLIGASAVVNQLVDTGDTEVPTVSGRKYLTRINSVVTIQQGTGTAISINDASVDNVHDLTAMFGTAIADYVYSLEQATAGSGIAYLRKYGFFTKSYYPYQANTLQSVKTSAHVMMSANRWDEEWEQGTFDSSTGEKKPYQNYWRSKNRIAVLPNTTYYAATSNDNIYRFYYDANGDYIGNTSGVINQTFTTPNGAYYLNIVDVTRNSYDSSSKPVSINYPSTITDYHAYSKHEYTLPNIDLRGLYKLDASNNLYADGDVLTSDGTLTRKRGRLTIDGTNVKVYAAQGAVTNGYAVFIRTTDYGMKNRSALISDKFIYVTQGYNSMPVMSFGGTSGATITIWFILPSTVTSKNEADAWFASNPTTIEFELETPTTEQVTGFTNPQIVDKYGTEEYTDERDFPMPVGHETDYPSR